MSDDEQDEKKSTEPKAKYIANPVELDGVPDLSMLVYLEMDNVLHNLHFRFCKMKNKNVYTSISTILVAINPYERLTIYGQDVIDEFHNAAKAGRLPQGRPHPYGVSARSYMRMIQRKCNQSVIVCGESGAGKTETTKLLMRYLAMTAPSATMESSIVEQQIIAASPILEAYGNAKTVLNNNSSRFGKFTKLIYDVPEKAREGHILGSYLETYLLEKSRVVRQAKNERNYHIFYFMHLGLDDAKKKSFYLSNAKDFHYARQGECTEVPGVNDKERFEELFESLKLMRIDEELQKELWKLTAGILNLGNVEFKKEGDGFCSVEAKSKKYIDAVADLWGIKGESLIERLQTATMKVVGKPIVKKITYDDAFTNRDSIAKGLYENAFLWLCERINAELYQTEEDEDVQHTLFIGILDVFGFENFELNSLEQFCINFTNEKLQQFFNFHIIQSEQEEYIKESVFWKPLSIPDNVECINMVEDGERGFFVILDSACKAPQPSVEAFKQELFKVHKSNKALADAKSSSAKKKKTKGQGEKFDGFMIHHFAAKVIYDASSFLIKNMEAVHPDTAKMLSKSTSPLVPQIGDMGAKKKKPASVTAVFNKGIQTLMKNLKATEPFFVRCVNPNKQKSATIWEQEVVEHQLRCGGLVEALKVLKLGYPTRVPYDTLYEKYHGSVNNPLIKNMGPESFSTALLIAFDVDEKDYELGLTKIFFKPAKAAILDTIMSQAGQPLTADQNEKISKWVCKKRLKQMMGITKSFLELRKRVRYTRAAKTWEYVGRVSSILAYSVVRHLRLARAVILERKRNEAARRIQTYFRGCYECGRYTKRIGKVKKAVKHIWQAYRRWDERKNLQKWLEVKIIETKKRREEEERLALAEKARQELEEKRLAVERKKMEEEMKKREEEDRKREEARLKLEEQRKKEEEIRLQLLEKEKEEARIRQERMSAAITQQKEQEEKREREADREKRNRSINLHKNQRREEEDRRKEKEEERYIEENFPEQLKHDDDEESANEDDDNDRDQEYEKPILSVNQQLKSFQKIASTGQLFLKYTGKRRRKPQDRIVKVSFDDTGKPKQISWGSGSRHIDFGEILYVAWGHYTPVFQARKDQLEPTLCFSVVGKTQILDVQAQTKEMAELWVRGLRNLIGQTAEQADKLAKEASENGNLPGSAKQDTEAKKDKVDHKKRTKSLILLQQDLFVMTTTTVFRGLEEERIWDIDQSVRDKFNARELYEEALKEDVPWRQWSQWIRARIIAYLQENGRVSQPNYGQYVQPAPFIPDTYVEPQQYAARTSHVRGPSNVSVQRLPTNRQSMVNNQIPQINPYPPTQFKPQPFVNPQLAPVIQPQQQQQQDENCSLM